MMKMFAIVLGLATFLGCLPVDSTNKRIEALEAEVARLANVEPRLASLEKQRSSPSKDVLRLQSDLLGVRIELNDFQSQLLLKRSIDEPAWVDATALGFGIAQNGLGSFPVMVKDATPYLDGFKIQLVIGNLTSGTATDVDLEITIGPLFPPMPDDSQMTPEQSIQAWDEWSQKIEENKKQRRTLKTSVAKELRSASWTEIEVVLAPSTSDDLREIQVKVVAKGVTLGVTHQ